MTEDRVLLALHIMLSPLVTGSVIGRFFAR